MSRAMPSRCLLVMVCLLASSCSPSGTTPRGGAGASTGGAGAGGATAGGAGGRGGTTSASPGFGGTGGSGGAAVTAGSGPAGPPDAETTADVTVSDATTIEAAGPVDGGNDGTTAPGGGERSAGCAVMNGLPEGDSSLPVGGMNRSFRLRLPAGYPGGRAWPLVLALHPNGGSGIGYWDGSARNLREVVR